MADHSRHAAYDIRINVHTTTAQANSLAAVAADLGMTLSEAVRTAFEDLICDDPADDRCRACMHKQLRARMTGMQRTR